MAGKSLGLDKLMQCRITCPQNVMPESGPVSEPCDSITPLAREITLTGEVGGNEEERGAEEGQADSDSALGLDLGDDACGDRGVFHLCHGTWSQHGNFSTESCFTGTLQFGDFLTRT